MNAAERLRIHTRLPRVAGAIQVGERVHTALESNFPLTVLRGARGFGKTSVLVTWLRTTTDRTPVIYHALDERSITAEGFWRELGRVLEQAGLGESSPDADSRQGVLDMIAALTEPLRLILDDMHLAGAAEEQTTIDHDLVEMVRTNDRFYLIAAGRSVRELESTGALSVESVVLGPQDLKFTAPQLISLAAALNVELEPGCAELIITDIGGWPAAIRAGLTNTTPTSAVDESLVAGYLRTVLQDMRTEAVRLVFLHTAVPETFDAALAAWLVPEDQNGQALTSIRVAGLLRSHTGRDGHTHYSYPPAIRQALLRVLRATDPDLEARIHQRLMHSAAAENDPVDVLGYAAGAGAWDTVADVVGARWVHLLTLNPEALVRVVDSAPVHVVDRDPRMRVVRQHRGALTDPVLAPRTRWPVTEPPTMAAEMVARAEQAGQHMDDEALALLLWGAACLTGGNHDGAAYAFNQARARGFTSGSTVAAVIGSVGLAVLHAMNGEPALARQWLAEPEMSGILSAVAVTRDDRAVPAPDVIASAAHAARALAAVDSAADDAEHVVATMVDPRHRGDIWAISVFARAHYAALGDDPEEVFRQANQVRAAIRHVISGSLAHTVLVSTLVELQLLARMNGAARQTAQSLDEEAIGWTTRAKVHLALREFESAGDLADQAVSADRISMRSLMESHVIRSAAHHAQGHHDMARRAFTDAVGVARATGQRRPFHLMSRDVFELLAHSDPALLGLWPGEVRAQVSSASDQGVELPTLTMREAQVLRALERYSGPVGIARSLDVSVNTVKTHLRAIYRKLGVSSRNEALHVLGHSGMKPPADRG